MPNGNDPNPTQINGRRIASTAFPMGIFSGNKRVTVRANATTMTPRPAFTIPDEAVEEVEPVHPVFRGAVAVACGFVRVFAECEHPFSEFAAVFAVGDFLFRV